MITSDALELRLRPAIAGKVAIVTGASSGIGEAFALELALAGAAVVLAARRTERLERLAATLNAMGATAMPIQADVTSREDITHLVLTTVQTLGRIDILANIAGWGYYKWLEEMSAEDLRGQFEANLLGMAEACRQVIPVMKKQRAGVILNMSSYASRIAVPPLTVYSATKYGVEGFSDGLRRELKPWGIHVVRVHPSGVTGTEYNAKAGKSGGITYRSAPIGKVRREDLARHMVDLIERPQRALFTHKLYEVPVLVNRLAPGVVDAAMAWWVRRQRAAEFRASGPIRPARYYGSSWALPILLLGLAALVLKRQGRMLVRKSDPDQE